jgi:hypothetical protein
MAFLKRLERREISARRFKDGGALIFMAEKRNHHKVV